MVKVAIFDYGAGNIFSLKNSLEKVGASVDVITNFDKPNEYSGLLLPGVGNFDPAIHIEPFVLGIPFCFLSMADAFLNATASDFIAASTLR